MSQETPKIGNEGKNKKVIELDMFHLEDTLNEINKRYPDAKINPSIIEGDQINGYTVRGEKLEEYAKRLDQAYSGKSDNSELYDYNR